MRSISDLALAAYLASIGHCLHEIRRTNDRGEFIFENTPSLGIQILDFYNRCAMVDPLTYAETLRNLKAAAQTA